MINTCCFHWGGRVDMYCQTHVLALLFYYGIITKRQRIFICIIIGSVGLLPFVWERCLLSAFVLVVAAYLYSLVLFTLSEYNIDSESKLTLFYSLLISKDILNGDEQFFISFVILLGISCQAEGS